MHEEAAWPRGGGHRGRGHGHGWGPPPPDLFKAFFGGPKFMRGPRVRRGDVRSAALALLSEEPRNGYQIIQEISARSGGVWRPSPGSVYPALQQLQDEVLIRAELAEGGRAVYTLTDEGRAYVEAHQDELRAPWDAVADTVGGAAIEMRELFGQVAMAAMQVARAGSEAQIGQARRVLTDARRALYRILASDDADGEDAEGQSKG